MLPKSYSIYIIYLVLKRACILTNFVSHQSDFK